MKIGWIGLGVMGQPMVHNLLKGGNELVVYNRTRSRAELFRSYGAEIADSPAGVCDTEIVFTMLWDDHAVEEVVFGENGILNMPGYRYHIGMSTVTHAFARRLKEAHSARGQQYISAPVFGKPLAAEAAKLGIIVAGNSDAVREVEGVLSMMGKVLNVGEEPWRANLIKLAGNFMIGAMLEVLGEAFALTRKAGIDEKTFLDVVKGTILTSPVYENYGKLVVEDNYATGTLLLGLKDLGYVRDTAISSGVPMPLAALVQDRLLTGHSRGYDDLDWHVIAKIIAEDAGLK